MTNIKDIMAKIILGVTWIDNRGTKLVDATTLLGLPNILTTIRKERGTVRGIRWIEKLPLA